jgi:hypothetical protein
MNRMRIPRRDLQSTPRATKPLSFWAQFGIQHPTNSSSIFPNLPDYVRSLLNHLDSVQLHCFSDASERAYAAAIYLRSQYCNGHVDVNLVSANTRVAPLKKQSVPSRLELLGANILVRLSNTVNNALQLPEEWRWCENRVLDRLRDMEAICDNKNKENSREYTTQDLWRHCPGVQNPGDLPSRGMNGKRTRKWKTMVEGPEFLYKPESEWPEGADIPQLMKLLRNSRQ